MFFALAPSTYFFVLPPVEFTIESIDSVTEINLDPDTYSYPTESKSILRKIEIHRTRAFPSYTLQWKNQNNFFDLPDEYDTRKIDEAMCNLYTDFFKLLVGIPLKNIGI